MISQLKVQLDLQGSAVALLQRQEVTRKVEKQRRLNKKENYNKRNRLRYRDPAASLTMVEAALEYTNQYKFCFEFTRSRDRVALLLLFFTGLRITNILMLHVNHLPTVLDPVASNRRL